VTPSLSLFARLKQWLVEHFLLDSWAQEQKNMERYLAQSGSLEELEHRQRHWDRERRAGRQFL